MSEPPFHIVSGSFPAQPQPVQIFASQLRRLLEQTMASSPPTPVDHENGQFLAVDRNNPVNVAGKPCIYMKRSGVSGLSRLIESGEAAEPLAVV